MTKMIYNKMEFDLVEKSDNGIELYEYVPKNRIYLGKAFLMKDKNFIYLLNHPNVEKDSIYIFGHGSYKNEISNESIPLNGILENNRYYFYSPHSYVLREVNCFEYYINNIVEYWCALHNDKIHPGPAYHKDYWNKKDTNGYKGGLWRRDVTGTASSCEGIRNYDLNDIANDKKVFWDSLLELLATDQSAFVPNTLKWGAVIISGKTTLKDILKSLEKLNIIRSNYQHIHFIFCRGKRSERRKKVYSPNEQRRGRRYSDGIWGVPKTLGIDLTDSMENKKYNEYYKIIDDLQHEYREWEKKVKNEKEQKSIFGITKGYTKTQKKEAFNKIINFLTGCNNFSINEVQGKVNLIVIENNLGNELKIITQKRMGERMQKVAKMYNYLNSVEMFKDLLNKAIDNTRRQRNQYFC